MPLQVEQAQKERIRFLYEERGLGPAEILAELKREFGEFNAASRATIVRVIRDLRLKREQEYGLVVEEGTLTKEGFKATTTKRREVAKPVPWTVGERGFNDENTALITQVLTEALADDMTIPGRTSIVLARWIARLRKAYPLRPAIIIWYAAYEAEITEYLEVKQKIKADYRYIDRALQFQPWKGDMEKSLYDEICAKERIGWSKNWWISHAELFHEAESPISHG